MKDFHIYPINLLFIKNLFGHYSELFSLVVNSCTEGQIDFLEIERKGVLEEVKQILHGENNIFTNKSILQEIKEVITIEKKLNLIMFNRFLAVVSLKVKADSKFSQIEKVFYIYKKIASYEDSIKKILMRNGNTL